MNTQNAVYSCDDFTLRNKFPVMELGIFILPVISANFTVRADKATTKTTTTTTTTTTT